MKAIECKDLRKVYNLGKENEVVALDGINFEADEGEFIVVLGASGAGKSTLLNVLGGMDRASSGSYLVYGKDATKYNDKQLQLFRRDDIGFVFQFYNLMPDLTAYENVLLAASVAKEPFDSLDVLTKVGLAKRAKNFPSELSGGEQQRVAIARAVVKNPRLLLCDEPTGALDSKTGASILQLLQNVCRDFRKTLIVVTHNAKIADVAERVIRIADGRIVSDEKNAKPTPIEEISW